MDLLRSEQIVDRLKLLNYEKSFLPKYRRAGIRAISKHYFGVDKVKSSTSQFYTFACICTWLCEECGRPMDMPDENDDPEDIMANIVQEARSLGISQNFSPLELTAGNGSTCLELLEWLCAAALPGRRGAITAITYPEEDDNLEQISPADISHSRSNSATSHHSAGSIIDEVETRKKTKKKPYMMKNSGVQSDSDLSEDEGDVADLDYVLDQQNKSLKKSGKGRGAASYEDWLDEVDRVAPNLKVVARLESKDWRARLDQISQHQSSVDSALGSTKPRLDRLEKDLTKALDTVQSRQKYMNSHVEGLLAELRQSQDRLAEREQAYEQVSGGLGKKSDDHSQLTLQLEQVKRAMEERGTSMTDGAPLVKLKQALNRIHQENSDMRLQSAVLEHQLTQMRMHKKSTLARDVGLRGDLVI